jgi:hypothetical protein
VVGKGRRGGEGGGEGAGGHGGGGFLEEVWEGVGERRLWKRSGYDEVIHERGGMLMR